MDSSSGGDDSTSHALGPQSSGCRFGPLDRSSVDRSFLGAAGVSQWPESPIVHVEGSRASEAPTKPPKFHEHSMRKLPREEKKNRNWSKRKTRNARNVGLRPPPLEPPPSLLLPSWPSVDSECWAPTLRATTLWGPTLRDLPRTLSPGQYEDLSTSLPTRDDRR